MCAIAANTYAFGKVSYSSSRRICGVHSTWAAVLATAGRGNINPARAFFEFRLADQIFLETIT